MTEFEREVVDRLARLETELGGLRKDLKGFKGKVVTIAGAVGAFVAALIAGLFKG